MALNTSSYVLEYKHCSAVGLKESMRLKSLRRLIEMSRSLGLIGASKDGESRTDIVTCSIEKDKLVHCRPYSVLSVARARAHRFESSSTAEMF